MGVYIDKSQPRIENKPVAHRAQATISVGVLPLLAGRGRSFDYGLQYSFEEGLLIRAYFLSLRISSLLVVIVAVHNAMVSVSQCAISRK